MKFLSEEWIAAVVAGVNGIEEFLAAAGDQTVGLLNIVNVPDETQSKYWLKLDGGAVTGGTGDMDGADVTVTQDYATAVGLAKRELSPVAAYMSGKLQVSNVMKAMSLQGALSKLPDILGSLDVEY